MATTIERPASAASFLAERKLLLINGEWVEARSGETFEVWDPADGETIARCAAGDAADVDLAVKAARRAFDDSEWSRMTASDRGRIVWRIGDLILENADELATIESIFVLGALHASTVVKAALAGRIH